MLKHDKFYQHKKVTIEFRKTSLIKGNVMNNAGYTFSNKKKQCWTYNMR